MAIDALQFVGGLLLGVAIGSVGSRLSRKARDRAPPLSLSPPPPLARLPR
jgi:hypothetical protein